MGHVSAPENRSRKNSRALTDKTLSRSPPPPRRGYGETAFALVERLAENVASPTGWPSRSSPRRGERRLAERVGFVPDDLAPVNDLRLIGSARTAKSTRNRSIRYKTGTAQSFMSPTSSRPAMAPHTSSADPSDGLAEQEPLQNVRMAAHMRAAHPAHARRWPRASWHRSLRSCL